MESLDLSAPQEIQGWPTVGDRLKEWLLQRVREGTETMNKHIRSVLPQPPVPQGGDIRASRFTPDEMAGMIPISAMTEKEVLDRLKGFMVERNPQVPGATQQGLMDVIKAIKSGLIGPQTYNPIEDIVMVAHRNPNAPELGAMMPRYEYLRDYKPLTTPTKILDTEKKAYDQSLWSVIQGMYDEGKLVPFGMLPQNEKSIIMLSNRGRHPIPTPTGRQLRLTPGHEFAHAGHLYGDEGSYVKEVFDRVNKMGPEKIRETALGLSADTFPEPELRSRLLDMYVNRQNPNELLADYGSRVLSSIFKGGK